MRHLIQAALLNKPPVVYTDHTATVSIAKKDNLSSAAVEQQNLRLIRASQSIQEFRLRVIHRPGKSNKTADTLSRLPSSNPTLPGTHNDLDSIDASAFEAYAFMTSALEVSNDLKARILEGYKQDSRWCAVMDTLRQAQTTKDPVTAKLPYLLANDGFLYFLSSDGDESLCLPRSLSGENFRQGFDTAWQKLRGLTFYKDTKLLKKYIKPCPECRANAAQRWCKMMHCFLTR